MQICSACAAVVVAGLVEQLLDRRNAARSRHSARTRRCRGRSNRPRFPARRRRSGRGTPRLSCCTTLGRRRRRRRAAAGCGAAACRRNSAARRRSRAPASACRSSTHSAGTARSRRLGTRRQPRRHDGGRAPCCISFVSSVVRRSRCRLVRTADRDSSPRRASAARPSAQRAVAERRPRRARRPAARPPTTASKPIIDCTPMRKRGSTKRRLPARMRRALAPQQVFQRLARPVRRAARAPGRRR